MPQPGAEALPAGAAWSQGRPGAEQPVPASLGPARLPRSFPVWAVCAASSAVWSGRARASPPAPAGHVPHPGLCPHSDRADSPQGPTSGLLPDTLAARSRGFCGACHAAQDETCNKAVRRHLAAQEMQHRECPSGPPCPVTRSQELTRPKAPRRGPCTVHGAGQCQVPAPF